MNSKAWIFLSGCVSLLILLALAPIGYSWVYDTGEIWQHLREEVLSELVLNTISLLLGTSLIAILLGVPLAWIHVRLNFPGRNISQWLLLLPLAFPTYVYAFVFQALFGLNGSLADLHFLGVWRVCLCMALALFPYVYIFATSAFTRQCQTLFWAGRSLGSSPFALFFKLSLPMAFPWILGSMLVVMMECLADFGAVSIFNYDTFTTAIYKTWFGLFSPEGAAQLASLLLLVSGGLVALDRWQSNKRAKRSGSFKVIPRSTLSTIPKWCISLFTFGFLGLASALPLGQLLYCSIENTDLDTLNALWLPLGQTIGISLVTGILALLFSIVLCYTKRLSSSGLSQFFVGFSSLGYSLPGSLLAIGIVLPIVAFDHFFADLVESFTGELFPLLLSSSSVIVILGLIVRFLAVSIHRVDKSFDSIPRSLDYAARSLGSSPLAVLKSILSPLSKTTYVSAIFLVALEAAKELPITLMTRPIGLEPLPVRIYQFTAEGDWDQAALPSLILVLLGLLGMSLLGKHLKEENT